MDDDLRDLMRILAIFLVLVFVMTGAIGTPILYLEGNAKSQWLKETKGVDIPWYQAGFLDVEINDVDAEVSMQAKRATE